MIIFIIFFIKLMMIHGMNITLNILILYFILHYIQMKNLMIGMKHLYIGLKLEDYKIKNIIFNLNYT
jgi:hypothetical protein